ncbi:MAG: VWA domain-containing protein [bacterium]|nr:VWA domain-containing protein [bacterium]
MMTFPFSAVVGQEQAKLALQLIAVDPGIGGVLLRGEKGSAKTTLARGLAALMDDAPFVELPLGATEDRLLGSIDIAAALTANRVSFRPGLLADAHGGVLYVDEVNLLADHLVDTLLDVAASGVNRVERDGVAHQHDARFVLVGSMNREEGELRPQLLDRFGLCVEVRAPLDPADRAEIVRRRLAFDRDESEGGYGSGDRRLAATLRHTCPADVPDEIVSQAAAIALAAGVEGLRADLVLCRAAAAHAALSGRAIAGTDDLRAVAPMAIAHRSRRSPFDPPVMDSDRLQQAIDDGLNAPPAGDSPPRSDPGEETNVDDSLGDGSGLPRPMTLGRGLSVPAPPRSGQVEAERGRAVRDVPLAQYPGGSVSVTATVRRAVADGGVADRRPGTRAIGESGLRAAVRSRPRGSLVILTVDTSTSMGAAERAEAATGSVLGLLADAYQRRDQVCMITFGEGGAHTILPPTGSTEVARRRLQSLQTGGATPLGAGLKQALAVATSAGARRDTEREPLIVLLSDGRATAATGDAEPFAEALEAAAAISTAAVRSIVVDCENGPRRLRLARQVARAMGARYLVAADLSPRWLDETIRRELAGEK